MTIIEIQAHENNRHSLESQSHRTECWLDGYISVPPELEEKAWQSLGYCNLIINDGFLTDIVPTEKPVTPEPEPQPTIEQLQEQITQTQLAMTEVYEMMLGGTK